MPEVFKKDKNGKFVSLGNIDPSKLVNTNDLGKYVKNFWTDKKSGKHPELAEKHKDLLKEDILVDPKDLFEQLKSNTFTFQDFGPLKLSNFLKSSKLDSYLKPEYVKHALDVTTHQPQVGKGEFLLVSCFNNINFSDVAGDLTDNDGNKIEVKGNHAPMGGPKGFKQMNKSIMFSIFRQFNTNPDSEDFTIECSKHIQKLLIDNKDTQKAVMLLLQNNSDESNKLADDMVSLFNDLLNEPMNEKEKELILLKVVAAEHLYAYLHLHKANFLFAINDSLFSGFATPDSLQKSYEIIVKNFDVAGWTTGNTGITLTLKKKG